MLDRKANQTAEPGKRVKFKNGSIGAGSIDSNEKHKHKNETLSGVEGEWQHDKEIDMEGDSENQMFNHDPISPQIGQFEIEEKTNEYDIHETIETTEAINPFESFDKDKNNLQLSKLPNSDASYNHGIPKTAQNYMKRPN